MAIDCFCCVCIFGSPSHNCHISKGKFHHLFPAVMYRYVMVMYAFKDIEI